MSEPWRALVEQLRRLRTFKVGLIYLGAAWLAMQLLDILIERGLLPGWAFPVLLYLIAAGLPLALIAAAALQGSASEGEAARATKRLRPLHVLAAIAILVLATFPAYFFVVREPGGPAPGIRAAGGLSPASIAVLYFDDHSEGGQLGYLAESLTEYVIHELAQVNALDVKSRNAVKPYRDTDVPLDSIARRLRVGTLVEGSVTGSRERVRISVQLIDANTLGHLESAFIDGSAEDPFRLLDEVGGKIARLLRSQVGLEVRLKELRAGTESTEAWELYRRAIRLLEDTDDLVASSDTLDLALKLDLADTLLARAQAADREWAEPVVERAYIASQRAVSFPPPGHTYDPVWLREGLRRVEHALALAPRDAGAHERRGLLLSYLAVEMPTPSEADSVRQEAERELRRAVELDPQRALAWSRLSGILRGQSRFYEAMLAAERAYEADAFMSDARVILFRLCQMSLELKNWEAVTRWCGEGRRRFPDRASFVSVEIAALAGPEGPSPDAAHAWELAGKTLELSPPQTRAEREALALMQVAAVLARAGLGDSARAVIGRARAVAPGPDPDLFYQEANAWLRLGQTDTALSLLAAYLEAQPDQRDYIAGDWWWAELRDDPRFQSLVAPSPGR